MMTKKSYLNSEKLQKVWFIPLVIGFFFMVGLWLFFPAQALQLRLEQELSQQLQRPVSVGELSLELPTTLVLDSLETTIIPRLAISLKQLKARPIWLQLAQGRLAIKLAGETLGGTIDAELDSSRHIQIFASDLNWDQPLPQWPKLQLTTTIEQLNASGFIDPINQMEQLQLQLARLEISGLKQFSAPIDQLNLGRIELQLSQNKRIITIEQFSSVNGDLNLAGTGTVVLQRNPMRSRIDLKVNLIPNKNLDPTLSSLLPLLGKKENDGGYLLHIGGTLEKPQLL